MTSFWTAVQFLTRVPTPALSSDEGRSQRAAYFYVPVGLAIGAVLAGCNLATHRWLPLPGRIVFLLTLSAVLTGGLHLDGLADTVDGVFGGGTRERRLEIMRDSRIGTFGVLGLLCILSLQFTALLDMPQSLFTPALLLAPAWSRAAMVLAATISSPARLDGLGAKFIASVRPLHAAVALFTVGGLSLVFSTFLTVWSAVASIAATCLLSLYFRSRLGGQTGDTLGATNQVVETAVLWVYLLAGSKA